ncbi:translation initiation factor eIF4A [Linnemannia zychae]|nr:translation initiation factor eIF4A [Linnemannia zychae]
MDLSPQVLEALYIKGIDTPTPVQKQSIFPIVQGRHVILKSQSNTGRLLSFVIAGLHKVDSSTLKTQVLMTTPSDRITLEIMGLVRELGNGMNILSYAYRDECDDSIKDKLEKSTSNEAFLVPHVVVGSLDRIRDEIEARRLECCSIKLLATSCSQMSPKLSSLQIALYFDLQTPTVIHVAHQLTRSMHTHTESKHISSSNSNGIENSDNSGVAKIFVRKVPLSLNHISNFYLPLSDESEKLDSLCDIYEWLNIPQLIVFVNTRKKLDWLVFFLKNSSSLSLLNIATLHADLSESDRASVLQGFRQGNSRILVVATPLVREDIDIAQFPLIVAYDLPLDQEIYLRRCGARWSRYGRHSVCISFVRIEEFPLLKAIEQDLMIDIREIPFNLADLV